MSFDGSYTVMPKEIHQKNNNSNRVRNLTQIQMNFIHKI